MRSNKDLTMSEFLCAQNIKRAMMEENSLKTKEFLTKALQELYK